MKIVKFSNKYYKQVNEIYKTSFPKEERYLSLNKLVINVRKSYAEMNCLVENDVVCGFLYSIKYEKMLFILYLAVNKNVRSCGYGSFLLKDYIEKNKNYDIYLNIDKVDESFEDYETRLKRLEFYEKNGLNLTEYLSVEEECDFNILSNKKEFNVEEYRLLDKFVAGMLEEPTSEIVPLKISK